LDQVVERLSAALVAAGELTCQRQEAIHERLARGRIAVAVVALEQPTVLARPCLAIAFPRPMIDRLQALSPFAMRSAPGFRARNVPRQVSGPQPN
jgi:hypothetical protein